MRPSVLFVCVRNGGKSQIAAALMRRLAGEQVEVFSAGTVPGVELNDEARIAVEEIGASMDGESPKPTDPAVLARVDRIVVLGAEARLDPAADMRGRIETWEIDEPSTRGVEGTERMRLVRDDIDARVRALYAELVPQDVAAGPVIRVFEPALCCNTGVCGPDVDEALVRFTADLDHLRGLGADIARHNLANDPGAFAENPTVRDYLKVAGSAGLPLTLVDGVTVATGSYPSRERLLTWAGLAAEGGARPAPQATPEGRTDLGLTSTSSCCGGGGCC